MQNNVVQDVEDVVSIAEPSEFLRPREIRKVLKEIEEIGVVRHLVGKKEIKSAERGILHAGKKQSSIEDDRDLGGKPSAYQVTQEFDKLKNVMEKPGATELLYQKMAASGLAYGLIKYQQLAFLYAVKMDETALPKLLGSLGKMFFPGKLTEEDAEYGTK
jgi:hypothetical protein